MYCHQQGRCSLCCILIRSSVWQGAGIGTEQGYVLSWTTCRLTLSSKLIPSTLRTMRRSGTHIKRSARPTQSNALQCVTSANSCDVVRHPGTSRLHQKQDKVSLTDGDYVHNAEEIEKMMIQKCIKVANLAANYDALSERITSLIARELVKKAQQRRKPHAYMVTFTVSRVHQGQTFPT